MTFPRKFKERLEVTEKDLSLPRDAWITYSVCGCTQDACGWEGWIIESVTNVSDENLPADIECKCPDCNRPLFRTSVSVKLTKSSDQTPKLVPGIDYEVMETEYED